MTRTRPESRKPDQRWLVLTSVQRPLGSGLTTFRKLVVGNRQIRIVYRVEDDGNVAVVWVVASRVDSECYDLAMARLALHSGAETRTALEELVREVFGKTGGG